jgi:hypothetical protein
LLLFILSTEKEKEEEEEEAGLEESFFVIVSVRIPKQNDGIVRGGLRWTSLSREFRDG